jgi:hypothetical protein
LTEFLSRARAGQVMSPSEKEVQAASRRHRSIKLARLFDQVINGKC